MVSSTSKLNDNEYTKLLQDVGFEPAGWGKIAAYLMQKSVNQMYHALVHEDDIVNLFNIPNLTIFWTCRCHHVAEDCSSSHEHLHALVQYKKGTHRAYKDRMRRNGQRFHSKTTFKPIKCPDHAVGVLRYICCKDGQRTTRRNADGLMGAPHTHYRRSVNGKWLLHKRSEKQLIGCAGVRLGILMYIKKNLDEEWLKENVSGHPHHLHHHETCLCDYGKIGIEKKKAANKKRRDFYETGAGKKMKEMYKNRAADRKDLIERVMNLQTGNNLAEMEKETILNLLKRMK